MRRGCCRTASSSAQHDGRRHNTRFCRRSIRVRCCHDGGAAEPQQQQQQQQQQPQTLAVAASDRNTQIVVLQMPKSAAVPPEVRGARVLLLGTPGDVHSMWRPDTAVTGCYWDALALLPSFAPEGPISILGLGGGTAVHLLHQLHPGRVVHGWELDSVVLLMAEMHLGLGRLQEQGCLVTHVGDALSPDAAVEGGSAGILVDLFADGALLPQLTQPATWRGIRQRLRGGGRVMANLGAWERPGGAAPASAEQQTTVAAVRAMMAAFEGQVQVAPCFVGLGNNLLALTGPPPVSAAAWAAALPPTLEEWRSLQWQPAAEVLV